MKVTSVYLEWLLKLKARQRLEAEAQEIDQKIRKIDAELQQLACNPAIANGQRVDRPDQRAAVPSSDRFSHPWGDYIFLLLLTLLVSFAFLM